MRTKKLIPFAAGLTLGFVLALGVAYAQDMRVFKPKSAEEQPQIILNVPAQQQARIIEGSDLAVRIQGKNGKRLVGTLLTKVDGKWVEVEFATHNAFAAGK